MTHTERDPWERPGGTSPRAVRSTGVEPRFSVVDSFHFNGHVQRTGPGP
ncbi:hypothetical protein AB0O64_36180 [Streptomyces sp. NPDC088341]